MKTKTHGIGITFQAGKGWKKCIGWYQHLDGRQLPKIHWLGHEQTHALYLATALQKAWMMMQLDGPRGWTPQDVANVKAYIGGDLFRDKMDELKARQTELERQQQQLNDQRGLVGQFDFVTAAVVPATKPVDIHSAASQQPMLYGAIKAYLDSLKSKRVSEGHKERATQILEVNLKRARPDCPLADVDFKWLESLADHFRARPASLKEDGKIISANTAALFLRYFKAFFTWLDDSAWGNWQGPRKLTKIFRCSVADLMTPAELRESATIKQFDIETLKKLYQKANNFTRRCLLLGLFTGATQMELTVMEKAEFDLDKGLLNHIRNKTRIAGEFWLPPEAVELLKVDFAKRPKDKLAFRSPEGLPLVMFKDGKKVSDSVRQAWDHLRDNAEVPDALSFKYLRKYLADYCTRHGGEELGMVAMSHARRSIVSKHYTSARQIEKFKELQKAMYAELKAAGLFDEKADAAVAA